MYISMYVSFNLLRHIQCVHQICNYRHGRQMRIFVILAQAFALKIFAEQKFFQFKHRRLPCKKRIFFSHSSVVSSYYLQVACGGGSLEASRRRRRSAGGGRCDGKKGLTANKPPPPPVKSHAKVNSPGQVEKKNHLYHRLVVCSMVKKNNTWRGEYNSLKICMCFLLCDMMYSTRRVDMICCCYCWAPMNEHGDNSTTEADWFVLSCTRDGASRYIKRCEVHESRDCSTGIVRNNCVWKF